MIEESKAFREKEKERRKRQWKRRRDDVSGSLFFCYAIVCACAFHLKKKKEHTLYRAAATRASRKANSALFSSRIRDKKKHSINPENNEKPAVCLYIITQVSRLAPFPLFFFIRDRTVATLSKRAVCSELECFYMPLYYYFSFLYFNRSSSLFARVRYRMPHVMCFVFHVQT